MIFVQKIADLFNDSLEDFLSLRTFYIDQDLAVNIISRLVALIGSFVLVLFASFQASASVVITGTRFVFPSDQSELTVHLSSKNNKVPVLIQAWVDDGKPGSKPDNSKAPFLVTPPLVRMGPGAEQSLRIIALANSLPADRESVFFLHVKEIPPKPTGPQYAGKNTLQIGFLSTLKLFWRPKGLPGSANGAGAHLTWKVVPDGKGYTLAVHNPTPYYVTLDRVVVSGSSALLTQACMVAPMGDARLAMKDFNQPLSKSASVSYDAINDFGTDVSFNAEVAP